MDATVFFQLLLPGLTTAPAQWATQGRLESVTISGGRSGLRDHAFVYLPPQYFDPGRQNERFPVLYMLHGSPGVSIDWVRAGSLAACSRALIAFRSSWMSATTGGRSIRLPGLTERK